jgi:hypothetical protein
MTESCFGATDIPDAFFYLHENLGGLGLRNPFISASFVRKSKTPIDLIEDYENAEFELYKAAKETFEETTRKTRRQRLEMLQPDHEYKVIQIVLPGEIDEWTETIEQTSGRYDNSTISWRFLSVRRRS